MSSRFSTLLALAAALAACRSPEPPPLPGSAATPAPAATPDPIGAALAGNALLTRPAAEALAASLSERGTSLVIEGLPLLPIAEQRLAALGFERLANTLDAEARVRWSSRLGTIRANRAGQDEPAEALQLVNVALPRMEPGARAELQGVCERAVLASVEARRGARARQAMSVPTSATVRAQPEPGTPSAPEAGPVAPTSTAPSPNPVPDDSEKRARLEKEWRERARQARERLARAEAALKAATYDPRLTGGVCGQDAQGRFQTECGGTKTTLDASNRRYESQREADAARQALQKLEEQARREGVPPGWLR
jgi:hypothetical protein